MRLFKIISFIFLLCILTFASVYFNVQYLSAVAIVLIAAVAVDVILFVISRGCRVNVVSDKAEYRKKSKGIIKLSVKNLCFYPVNRVRVTLSVKNRYYNGKTNYYVFPLGILCNKKIRIPFVTAYNGIYDIKVDRIEYTDMFGILKRKQICGSKYSFMVLPTGIADSSIDISGNIDTDNIPSDNVYSSNVGDISSFREYREGDRLNNVNWKLSARMDNIYVKEYEKTSMDEAVILLDMYIRNLDVALDNLYSILKSKTNFYVLWLPAGAEEFKSKYVSDNNAAADIMTDIYNSAPDMLENRGINEYKRLYKGHKFLYVSNKTESV